MIKMMKNKPIRYAAAICVAAALSVLPGCGKSGEGYLNDDDSSTASDIDNDIERISVSVVRDTFEDEIAVLKSVQFDNISFADLKSYSFPDVSEITTYKVVNYELGGGLSPEQFFDNFIIYCNYLEPGKYTRDEIAEMCGVQGNFGFDPNEMGRYLNYNEFLELNKDGQYNITYLHILTSELYLAYNGSSAPAWYCGDKLKKHLGIEDTDRVDSPVNYSVIDYEDRPVVYFTENMNSTKVYHLMDGDISIADAAKKANKLLAEIAGQCDDGAFCNEVCAVNVVDMGNGNYGYVFAVTDVVGGIKFAYADARGGIGLGVGLSHREEGRYGGCGNISELEMVRSDELWSFKTTGGWKGRTPVETYDSIVPLNNAAENVASLLSGKMNFNAKSVTLVYDIKGDGDDLLPCWRFILEDKAKPKEGYHVYVNALTGEARVKCIQNVDYRYEYD